MRTTVVSIIFKLLIAMLCFRVKVLGYVLEEGHYQSLLMGICGIGNFHFVDMV